MKSLPENIKSLTLEQLSERVTYEIDEMSPVVSAIVSLKFHEVAVPDGHDGYASFRHAIRSGMYPKLIFGYIQEQIQAEEKATRSEARKSKNRERENAGVVGVHGQYTVSDDQKKRVFRIAGPYNQALHEEILPIGYWDGKRVINNTRTWVVKIKYHQAHLREICCPGSMKSWEPGHFQDKPRKKRMIHPHRLWFGFRVTRRHIPGVKNRLRALGCRCER